MPRTPVPSISTSPVFTPARIRSSPDRSRITCRQLRTIAPHQLP
jgi:hypothetical protein